MQLSSETLPSSPYLSQQGGDDVQGGLVDGLVLQRGGEGHVHQRPDLLQHHLPPAGVAQDLAVLVDLFLEGERAGVRGGTRNRRRWGQTLQPVHSANDNNNDNCENCKF